MKCQIQNHNGQKMLTVCMDKECKVPQRLCCLLCLIDSHNTHLKKTTEIDYMDAFIQEQNKKQNKYPESCSFGQKQLIQGLEKLLTLIDSLQKIIKERIEITKQQNLQDYLKKVGNSQQGIEHWNRLLEDIFQYVEVDNCLIKLTTSKEGELNQMEEQEIKFIKQSEENLYKMINQIKMKIGKLCFKENRKHVDIVLVDECTIKKTNTTSYAMAFANEGFDPKCQSYAFAFNIQNMNTNQWVTVGVGNDEGNSGSPYLFDNYGSLGHGKYLISPSKQTYHHTDIDMNSKSNGINSKVGDKIQIKYDHTTKVLEFRKQSEQNTVIKMVITDMTKKLYPCVCLYTIDNQAQLVEY